jgi:aminopeptidase N
MNVRRARWLLLLFLSAGSMAGPGAASEKQDPGRPPSVDRDDRGYDCLAVDLEIAIDFQARAILGTAVHRFRPTRVLDRLRLDLTDSLQVTSVRRGSREIPFTHQGRALVVPLDPPLDPADGAGGDLRPSEEVTIRYSGRPPRDGILGFAFMSHDGTPGAFTVSEPASASSWWPCKDVPNDKLTALVTLNVPDTLYAGSNGRLVADETLDGRRTMTWREEWPVAPYLIGIAVTRYAPFGQIYTADDGRTLPLLFLPYPEHRALAEESWGRVRGMLAAFEGRFGPYPFPGEKYGMAEFPWGGAMENQTLTSYGEYLVDGTDQNDWEVAHELAHSWWGNKVTLDSWEHIWLNEGFARYSEALWFESQAGIEGYRDWIRGMWRPDFPGAIVPPESMFNPTVYLKGAWVLHMLRGVLGDSVFFEAIRAYGERFAYANATTEDLITIFEQQAGRDLRWFFDPWVYGSGRPAYLTTWTTEPAPDEPIHDRSDQDARPASPPQSPGAALLDLTIEQIQAEPPYRMPVQIEIRDPQGNYRLTVEDSLRVQEFRLPVRMPPHRVLLDPDDWILKATVGGSDVSGSSVPARIGAPSPCPGAPPFRIPLPAGAPGGWIEVLDVVGRRVVGLPIDGSGTSTWDGRDQRGRDAPPGLYLIRVAGPGQQATRRIVLLR